MNKYKMIKNGLSVLIIGLFSSILFSCSFAQNNDKKTEQLADSINYYSERIVIFWCPTEQEYEESMSEYSEEDRMVIEDGDNYYLTEAYTFIRERFKEEQGVKFITLSDELVGFVINKDTIILKKEDFKQPYFDHKIILFDGQNKPSVIEPDNLVDTDEYHFFFGK